MLVKHVDQESVLNAWQRAGFLTPTQYAGPHRATLFEHSSEDIYSTFAQNAVEWTNPGHCLRAIKAMSTITRRARNFAEDYDRTFWTEYRELEIACHEDGFELQENGTIGQASVVSLDDFEIGSLWQLEGVMHTVKRLNRAITTDRDPSDIVGYAKNLTEAVSAAILSDLGMKDEDIRDLKVQERTSEVQKRLGINDPDTELGAITTGLEEIKKGLNKVIMGISKLRNTTDAGHANHVLPDVNEVHAHLAVDAALAWCRFALGVYEQQKNTPPF